MTVMPPSNEIQPLITQDQRSILVAAVAGAMLSLLFMGEPFKWKSAVTAVLCGVVVAYYGCELISGAFHLDPGYFGAIGAGLGFGSMTVLGGFYKLLSLWRDDPGGFIQRFVPFFRRGGGQ